MYLPLERLRAQVCSLPRNCKRQSVLPSFSWTYSTFPMFRLHYLHHGDLPDLVHSFSHTVNLYCQMIFLHCSLWPYSSFLMDYFFFLSLLCLPGCGCDCLGAFSAFCDLLKERPYWLIDWISCQLFQQSMYCYPTKNVHDIVTAILSLWAWWLSGRFGALHPESHRFDG